MIAICKFLCCITKPVMVSETYLVDVCDETGDKYRFGFNGQEKVNEISGIGNHNTAEFWEYDTRLGRRWNLDPVDQVSISNYSTFGNNPIKIIDHNGDKIRPWDDMEEDRSNYYKNRKNKPPQPKYFVDIGNLNKFNSQMIELMSTNKIFDLNYWLLESSKTEYKIEQINVYGYAGYSIENKLIRIGVKGYGDDAGISKGDLFEEFFHAGQDEFYTSLGIKRSALEDEVEAKVANLLSGFKDITLKQEYTAIKEYFETGKKSKDFNKELDVLIKDVYETYKSYKPNMFSKPENQPKNVNKKNVLKYLDYLNKKIKNNEGSK